MTTQEARALISDTLQQRYTPGEAASIARIVLEDGFPSKNIFLPEDQRALEHMLHRLVSGEPVQYVVGKALFWGFYYTVTPAVLIPRQETEELVAWILERLDSSPVVGDIGLGSGCIGLTLKKKYPALQLWGMEISAEALEIARQNATLLGLEAVEHAPQHGQQVAFLQADIRNSSQWPLFPRLDLIVSNPPYVPPSEKHLLSPEVAEYEPSLALFTPEQDPLLFYRKIAEFAACHLKPGGALYFECNPTTAEATASMLEAMGFDKIELKKDIPGVWRMLAAKWNR